MMNIKNSFTHFGVGITNDLIWHQHVVELAAVNLKFLVYQSSTAWLTPEGLFDRLYYHLALCTLILILYRLGAICNKSFVPELSLLTESSQTLHFTVRFHRRYVSRLSTL